MFCNVAAVSRRQGVVQRCSTLRSCSRPRGGRAKDCNFGRTSRVPRANSLRPCLSFVDGALKNEFEDGTRAVAGRSYLEERSYNDQLLEV